MKTMLKSIKKLTLAALYFALLSACGQKGPLMLPEKNAAVAKAAPTNIQQSPGTKN